MEYVLGSGRAIMSLSSMRTKPSTDEPSKPKPSSNARSNSSTLTEKLFRKPRMSVNHILMNFTFCSLIRRYTCSLASAVFFSDFTDFAAITPPCLQTFLGAFGSHSIVIRRRYFLDSTASWAKILNSASEFRPRSSPLRRRTETPSASTSLSPTTSM